MSNKIISIKDTLVNNLMDDIWDHLDLFGTEGKQNESHKKYFSGVSDFSYSIRELSEKIIEKILSESTDISSLSFSILDLNYSFNGEKVIIMCFVHSEEMCFTSSVNVELYEGCEVNKILENILEIKEYNKALNSITKLKLKRY